MLDIYFPFDPYCLQFSDKYIRHIYQNWAELNVSVEETKNNLSVNYGFMNDKTNNISDIQYDRENMIEDLDNNIKKDKVIKQN